MKKFLVILFFVMGGLGVCNQWVQAKPHRFRVAITQVVAHESLDTVRRGILETLKKEGFSDLEIIFENAQGNLSLVAQIAQKFASQHPDVVVAISTASAQACVNALKKDPCPCVFAAVTDPVGAGLVTRQGKLPWLTGVTDRQPTELQVKELVDRLHPRRIGVLFNPGEPNSVAAMECIREAGKKHGVQIVEAVVGCTRDITMAAQKLVGCVDLIYVPTDNTVVSAIDTLVRFCREQKIRLFAADPNLRARGTEALVGVSYEAVGHLAGMKIAAILRGATDLPVENPPIL